MMKFKQSTLAFFSILFLTLPSIARAAVFDVSTIGELETALAEAQSNGEDDTIILIAGTYELTAPLTYTASEDPVENYSLTIQGTGGQVILDGRGSYRILKIKTLIGGQDTSNAHITIEGITFWNGHIDDSSVLMGAGLNVWTHNSDITIKDSEFINNIASHIYRDPEVGGAFIKAGGNGTATLIKNTFSGNSSQGIGGGAYVISGAITLTNNVFSNNEAITYGGGANVYSIAAITVVNNTFSGNIVDPDWGDCSGGGLYVHLYSDGSSADIYNNIIWGNTATSGTGEDVYLENDGDGNSIGATVNLYNNDFSDLDYQVGDNLSQGNNIDQDPLLAGGSPFDCHIAAGSPCIDDGDNAAPSLPATDFEGDERIIDGNDDEVAIVDMGADEYLPPTPTTTPTATLTPTSTPTPTPFGYKTPIPTPTPAPREWIYDYNGDGTSDIAVFRPGSALWSVRGLTRLYFGTVDDIPIPGDYDGNGTTDIGIYRDSIGLWVLQGITRCYFGKYGDQSIPGDYDGDGCCDIGIFRDGSSLWVVRGITRLYFGKSGDTSIPGYYDGDGTKDVGIFRSNSGLWVLRKITRIYFGAPHDRPIPGDFDGSGTWMPAIFRPTSGLWVIRGMTRCYFGKGTDQPCPADYDGDLSDNIGIFRSSSGLWVVRGITRIYYGASGDIRVTR